jgi:hypothetical protein
MGRVAENVSAPFFVLEAPHSVAIDSLIPNSFADCYITSFARHSGYSVNPYCQTTSADSKLSEWMEVNNLNLVSPKSWTWESSHNISGAETQRAYLDFFVTNENSYECTVHLSLDPAHYHMMVCIGIPHFLISPFPELPSTAKKGRLQLSDWNGARPGGQQLKEEWKESFSEALQKLKNH